VESVGVNVTFCVEMPSVGTIPGDVNAKVPGTLVVPPVNTELASVWPDPITEAVGATLIVEATWLTVTLAVVDAVL